MVRKIALRIFAVLFLSMPLVAGMNRPDPARIKGKASRVKALLPTLPPEIKREAMRRMRGAKKHFDSKDALAGEKVLDGILADFSGAQDKRTPEELGWSRPERVVIEGYDKHGDHKMELGVSRSGQLLFFNNSNKVGSKTDVFFATRLGEDVLRFKFRGPVQGANQSGVLDATPAYDDKTGVLSFVSTRVLPPALHWGTLIGNKLKNVSRVPINVYKPEYALGMEFGSNTDTIFFTFRTMKNKDSMDISMAKWNGKRYIMDKRWKRIFRRINTAGMEYAPEVSSDLLELWFTRMEDRKTMSMIYGATRKSSEEPFGEPKPHPTITGFVEAVTLTGDDKLMYYHCRDMETQTWEVCLTRRLDPP